MSLMTPEEIRERVPKGLWAKHKCDNKSCRRAILSSMFYAGTRGEYCSNACYLAGEGFDRTEESFSEREKRLMAEKELKKKHKNKEDDKPKKKKKATDEDEDEDRPKKKKKSSDDDKPAKGDGKNPYSRPSSAAYQVFEMAKKGTTKKAINKFLESEGCAPARIWKELKSGEMRGMKWKYISQDGNITVKVRSKE